jgi:hypothetical protein
MSRETKAKATEAGERTLGLGSDSWLEVVRRQVGSLHFGVVQIIVHESQVVQIERTEKVRLDKHSGEAI